MSGAALTTNWSTPWVLLQWGCIEPDSRLGFIKKAIAENGEITGFMAVTVKPDGTFTETPRFYRPADVFQEWRKRPGATSIRRAKARLKPVRADDPIFMAEPIDREVSA